MRQGRGKERHGGVGLKGEGRGERERRSRLCEERKGES